VALRRAAAAGSAVFFAPRPADWLFAALRLLVPLSSLLLDPPTGGGAQASLAAYPLDGNSIWSGQPVRRPNIYWLSFDGYPNQRTLRDFYDFDSTHFNEYLTSQGFYVAERSYSNYNKTKVSIATTLNMEHIFEEGESYAEIRGASRRWKPGRTRSGLPAAVAGDNRTVAFLKQAGYAYLHFDNRRWGVFRCQGYEDVCITVATQGLSEVQRALLELTPLHAWFPDSASRPASAVSGTGIPEFTRELAALRVEGPFFLYAHLEAPHTPFLNRADCTRLARPSSEMRDLKGQLRCVNRQQRALLAQLLRDDPEAIVLLSGDHGPRLLGLRSSIDELTPPQIRERLGILAALRLPAECQTGLRDDLTPVNFMRTVFACLGGHAPKLVPEQHFIVGANTKSPDFGTIRRVKLNAN